MTLPGKNYCLMVGLALVLLLALNLGPATPARAAAEDVAMFYNDLAPYGSWVDYGNYGPVWYPTQGVTSNWRPYMDGRWVPTSGGWTFETQEPWGWATYHYGNWMPTTEYGWVWNPGSTWYPSTAAWRTSDQYVGWAPIPPPDYVPEPAYYPEGGYYSGMPMLDLLSAPFWIFAQAANFLLGWGYPYAPAYSYYNCGCLSPFSYAPVAFANTLFLSDFCYPSFYHRGFYAYGPPFPYVSRVTNVNIVRINNFARGTNFSRLRGTLPPERVLTRSPWLRHSIPDPVLRGQRFNITRVSNPRTVGRLADPRVMKPPASVPRLTKEIPRGVTPQAQPAVPRGGAAAIRGAGRVTPGVPVQGRAPAHAPAHMTAPARPPSGKFRAPGREGVPAMHAPAREFHAPTREFQAPSRGSHMPPPSTHELTPRMQQQIRQYHRAPSSFRPSAPAFHAPARSFHAPAPSFHAPAPHMAPSAPHRSAPAPAPHPSAPAPGGGGGFRGGPHR
jgi:Family of unknown function (DUF6600)